MRLEFRSGRIRKGAQFSLAGVPGPALLPSPARFAHAACGMQHRIEWNPNLKNVAIGEVDE
jgi:hypothetical protein